MSSCTYTGGHIFAEGKLTCKCGETLAMDAQRVFDQGLRATLDEMQRLRDEVERLKAENAELKWFEREINSRVMPGETDSGDAASIVIRRWRDEVAKLREALKEIAEPRPDHEVPSFEDEDYAEKLLEMVRARRDIARKALKELPK